MAFLASALSSVTEVFGFTYNQCNLDVKASHPDGTPITSQKVKVYAQLWFFNISIGEYKTDREGRFNAQYNWVKWPFQTEHTLIFHIYEETMSSKAGFLPVAQERIIQRETRTFKAGLGGKVDYDVHDLKINLYEYDEKFPKEKLPEDKSLIPQQWNFVDYYRLAKATVPVTIKDKFIDFLEAFIGPLSNRSIANIHDIKDPKVKLDEATTLEMVMNGVYPKLRKVEGTNEYVSEVKWYDYETSHPSDLPDATLVLTQKDDGKLAIKCIKTQYRNEAEAVHYPTDDRFLENGLFIFNRAAFVKGSLAFHLGIHFEVGQFAMACFRTLNDNPIKKLLGPHLEGVLEINREAESVIVEVLTDAGLTAKGIWDHLADVLGGLDFMDEVESFIPAPINDDNYLFKDSLKIWNRIGGFIDTFFDENVEDIKKYWYEVFYMNKALSEHSVPLKAWDGRDVKNKDTERLFYDGHDRALSSITQLQDNPEQRDIDRLKRFCQYAIYRATWGHFTLHISERIGLDPEVARFSPDLDDTALMADKIQRQITVGNDLQRFIDAALVDNPNHNIYPPIVAGFRDPEFQKELVQMNYLIERMFKGLVI